jgi:hypothetical protein
MTDIMTRADRETLLKIARQRERVAKSDAKERAARLVADFEMQLDREYKFDESSIWQTAHAKAEDAAQAANIAIAAECERLGIPKAFAPGLALGWYGKGENAAKGRRAELRRIAARQIEAAEKSARAAIERQSLTIQESIMVSGLTSDQAKLILESMPSPEALMPVLAIQAIKALVGEAL